MKGTAPPDDRGPVTSDADTRGSPDGAVTANHYINNWSWELKDDPRGSCDVPREYPEPKGDGNV